MTYSKPTKRKLSDSAPNDPPSYADAVSPLGASPASTPYHDSTQDIDLFSAAEALTRLNTSATAATSVSLAMSTPRHHLSRSPSISSPTDATPQVHPIVLLVNAMSRLPIVTNAVKYYETSKRNYATFNYAAAFVEKAAIPVFSKIEVNLNNIHQARQEKAKKKRRLAAKNPKDRTETKKRLKFCLHVLKLANEQISSKVTELQLRISDQEQQSNISKNLNEPQNSTNPQNVDDSSNLENPQLSIANKESQLDSEKSMEVNLNGNRSETPVKSEEKASQKLSEKGEEKFEDNELTRVSSTVPEEETNTEIVKTVKKIIHIISNFRPSSLSASGEENPELIEGSRDEDVKLRSTIRNIILNLPTQIQKSTSGPLPCQDRVMEFARESLDMISLLTTVFNEQLEKAENWVDGPEPVGTTEEQNNEVTPIISEKHM